MGVPAFFRWLSDKFPRVITRVIEEKPKYVDGQMIPVDTTKPNPNGEEFDNLYLDMNGIIHPCCHPENKPAPATEDDMMVEIFAYLDRIVDIIRPRQLLYMAIDGVAPRAKMNQQRSRRFRAAQLAEIERENARKLERELEAIGQSHQLPEKKEHFDSNCITPGTPFMAHLATCLRYHIAAKQNTDPLWKNLKVILSDATVPGEGEHKIMEYIRVQRSRPHHNPNTSHVIYGLDADLIMLALGTHEPHFKVLREDVFFETKKCKICQRPGHNAANCTAKPKTSAIEQPPAEEESSALKPYVFLDVNILREYLEHALKFNVPGVPWDLERAIDDWVFMCFFVGNDFLPHLPSLEIREGAISTLSLLWKQCMPMMGGYMTHNGEVDLKRVQILVHELGKLEDSIFAERKAKEERRNQNIKRRKLEDERRKKLKVVQHQEQHLDFAALSAAPVNDPDAGMSNSDVATNRAAFRMANQNAAAALKAELLSASSSTETTEEMSVEVSQRGTKRKASEVDEDEEDVEEEDDEDIDEDAPDNVEDTDLEAAGRAILAKAAAAKKAADDAAREREPEDAVRFWEAGWKERYYKLKFGLDLCEREAINDIVRSYCEGLVWVFKYYYRGCISWSWYYPYYYAPMASDFVNIGSYEFKFEKSAPLKPFEQLMGVLPAASRAHIPAAFHSLMIDEDSPIIDYYPTEFEVDMDGKKWEWQGVVKLPFIQTDRLLKAMSQYYDQLTEEEKSRNCEGPSILFVAEGHKLYNFVSDVYTKRAPDEGLKLDPKLSSGMTGSVDKDPDCIPRSTLYSPLPSHDLPDISNDKSISVIYRLPKLPDNYVFPSGLLKGVKADRNALGYEDIQMATFEKVHRGHRANYGYGVPYSNDQYDHRGSRNQYDNRSNYYGNQYGDRYSNQYANYYSQQQQQHYGSYYGNYYGGSHHYGGYQGARGGYNSNYHYNNRGWTPRNTQYDNRGWVPQVQHMEEYREYNNFRQRQRYRGQHHHNPRQYYY